MGHIRRFFTLCLPIAFTLIRCSFTFLTMKINFCQIVANLPEYVTGTKRNLEMFKIWVFFGKNRCFFSKKNLEIFQNCQRSQFFSRMRPKWYYLLKMSFHLFFEVFWPKIRKYIKLEKSENMLKKQSILKRNRIHLSKRQL